MYQPLLAVGTRLVVTVAFHFVDGEFICEGAISFSKFNLVARAKSWDCRLSANFVYDLPFLTLRNEAVHLLFKTTP